MKIKNRSASVIVYTIADLNVRRRFVPGEIKEVPKEEIEKLLYQPGGRALFTNNLQVGADDLVNLGFDKQEPEYYYSEQDVKEIMVNKSLDEFLDFLDFAPAGAISIAKELAVSLPLSDMNKAEALKKATGFDVLKAIGHAKAVNKDLGSETQQSTTTDGRKRRVEATNPTENKYKVIG